ncbi:MAG: AI-2E family transporter [Erysipelotrichales bacterium]|nr:AI-2E family transporter [Erysipelotrichales bacterium]MBQ1387036.1 AI-2E family transporter [Erysipelotrichales bacterium]MBQ4375760.1 AI-2E family transporter [Erysipelotrichales bacterium]MBQ5542309.1 AI-2E family transporter [Erysipelotrichales bacterium]
MKKKFELDQNTMYKIITISVVCAVLILAYNLLPGIRGFFTKMLRLMTPFFVGFAIALMVRPVEVAVESYLTKNTNISAKAAKIIAVSLSILLVIIVIVLFFVAIIPQLTNSILTIADQVNTYTDTIRDWLDKISSIFSRHAENRIIEAIDQAIRQFMQALPGQLVSMLNKFVGSLSTLITSMGQVILGLVISVYFLSSYEMIRQWVKRIIRALLPERAAETIIGIAHTSIDIFSKFVAGKALDSMIIGVLCLIGCLIMNFEFPYLIAFIVAITNMIPFFGPFIGAVPSVFILLFNNPWHALWFAVFILVLQQIDGNFIGPKIIGGQLGMPSLMIIFSVIVGGGVLGVFGMFLGVPFFALLYTLLKERVLRIEKEKKLEENQAT